MKFSKFILSLFATILTAQIAVLNAASVVNESLPRPDSIAGNSVDTATGAFIQDVNIVTLEGARLLDLNASYNSKLIKKRGDMGYGWSHQYEARIQGPEEGTVMVYINGNVGNQFRYSGDGQNYIPLDLQNKYDKLIHVSGSEWVLTRQSGTKYVFAAEPSGFSYPLISLQNRNNHALNVEHADGKPYSVMEPISGRTIFFNYRKNLKTGSILLHYLVHGSAWTFLKFDEDDRLSRIYDPTKLTLIGNSEAIGNIPQNESGVVYPISVSASETDRLIRVQGSYDHAKPETLTVYLTSPSGTTVQIDTGSGVNYFLDEFIGENLTGSWSVRVVDNVIDGVTGSIRSFRIQKSTTPANWIQYDYNVAPFNRLIKTTDSLGDRISSNVYNSDGRVVFQDDGRNDNGVWKFEYETNQFGQLVTTVYDRTAAAHATTYTHDSDFRLLSIVNARNQKTQFFYNPGTRDRGVVIDARNNETGFVYDDLGYGLLTAVVTANNGVTKFGYDEFPLEGGVNGGIRGNLTKVVDALGNISTYKYDQLNNLVSIKNALGIEQSKTYDQNGQLVITVNKDFDGVEFTNEEGMVVAANILNGPKEKFEYDGFGRLKKIIDADGNASSIVYDLKGNTIEKSNDQSETIRMSYDHRNRLISETDANENNIRYEYDGNGNAIRSINPLGEVIRYEYDGEDRLIRVTGQDGKSRETHYTPLGQVSQHIDELGRTISYTYDEVGNQTAVYAQSGLRVSLTTYNNINLPETETDAHGNTTTFEYDLLGQLVSSTDPTGKKTVFEMDELGRVNRVIDPLLREYQKVYTDDDVLDKILDAAEMETSFTYTDKNEVETITTPGGNVTSIEYSGAGYISLYSPPSGKNQAYFYDKASRLTLTKHITPGAPDIHYEYDKNGNLTILGTQDSPSSQIVPKIRRTYDALDRVTSITNAENKTISYTYTSDGQVDQITYPDGKTVTYTYDAGKRLESITDWEDRVTLYTWNIHNKLDSILFPNDTLRVMTYDDTGRIRSRADYDASGETIVSYEYSYERNGFLSSERLDSDPFSYEPEESVFLYDEDNRLVRKNSIPISHDADGNVIAGPVKSLTDFPGLLLDFEWDAQNNLVDIGGLTYLNDAEDNLVGWVNGPEVVKFTTVESKGGSQVLVNQTFPFLQNPGHTTRYVYGVGLAYEDRDGAIKVHHYDERGNTVAITNESGEVSGTLAYSPYGEIISQTGDTLTIYKFGGLFGVITSRQNLNYMRYRWYSPEMRRFISLDSSLGDISLPGSLNRYAYANNNPINFVDPEGEFINVLIGAGVGAVFGAGIELVGSAIKGEPVNWNNVAAAAIGGAIAGAYSTAGCPTCGGALGGLAEEYFEASFNGRGQDIGELVTAGVAGGIGGKITSKVGRKTGSKWGELKAWNAVRKGAKKGISAAETLSLRAYNSAVRNAAATSARSVFKDRVTKGAVSFPFKVAWEVYEDDSRRVAEPQLTRISGLIGRVGKTIQAATTLPTANIGQGGEYQHNQLYLKALGLADRPRPDAPLALSSF